MTNRSSDCVTGNNLDKNGKRNGRDAKRKWGEGKQGDDCVENASIRRSDSVGLQREDDIYIKTHSCPAG